MSTFITLKHNNVHYWTVLFFMSYSSLIIQLNGFQLTTHWTWLLNGTKWNTCLHSWDNSVQSPRNDHTLVFNHWRFKLVVRMRVLPYLAPYKNDLLCLHENNYQNILMALVSADDNSLFWLDKHCKVYIYESSMLVLFCIYSNSVVRNSEYAERGRSSFSVLSIQMYGGAVWANSR